jgi:lathosterol oxidase
VVIRQAPLARIVAQHTAFLTMDFVLQICDDYFLDHVWAKLVPLTAFATSPELTSAMNTTAHVLPFLTSNSKWAQIVSLLPHPPIAIDNTTLLHYSSIASHPIPQVSAWPRDYVPRQIASLIVLTLLGIHVLYFLFAGLSYRFIFNHDMMRHPRFLKNQVKLEIQASLKAFPFMTFLTLPWFQGEVMGYSRLYDGLDTYGYTYLVLSVPL